MVHRFVHLSDIHFGQEKKGSLITHTHIRDEVTNDVSQLATQRGPASRILVTGDIAYSGKHNEYKMATHWLEVLTKAAGCDETHVSTIPGNHDCDLSAISNLAKMTYASLRLNTPEQIQPNFNSIVEDGEASNPFLPKLKAYREFAIGFGCDFESGARPLWVRDFERPDGIRIRFHGLTSVQVSDLNDKVGTMVLGNQQFTIAENANVINVVLCHHPLAWFIDEKEASKFLQNNVRVIMVGHEHDSNVQKTTDAFSKREWLVVYAGAVSPPDAEYKYCYNWLEFSCVEEGGQYYLLLEIFPRVWVPGRVSFEADRTLLGGSAESCQVRIHCPNIKKLASAQSGGTAGTDAKTAPQVDKAKSEPVKQSGPSPTPATQGGDIMDVHSANFDRLRYLFWRYLDWRQRLKALVDADALPNTADQPVPQTLERKALENAAGTPGKLYELWDAVMPFVPEEKREKNPFQPKP